MVVVAIALMWLAGAAVVLALCRSAARGDHARTHAGETTERDGLRRT